jgi:hypothetical protein
VRSAKAIRSLGRLRIFRDVGFLNVLIAFSVWFDDAGNFVHTRCFTVLAPANV